MYLVIRVKTRITILSGAMLQRWIPAFAGMTSYKIKIGFYKTSILIKITVILADETVKVFRKVPLFRKEGLGEI